MMKKPVLLLPFLMISLLAASDRVTGPVITAETAGTFYRSFHRVTETPRYVSPLTAALCISPSPELIEREKKASGPHYMARVHFYLNELGAKAVKEKANVFPEGAIVVKEKLADGDRVSGVGGMVKREAGYDSKNGDWEYFYSDKEAGFSKGRLPNCIECHAGTKKTDFVFSVW